MPNKTRLDQLSYFTLLAIAASLRSTCLRRSVGAVMVSEDNRVISTGYNGSISGTDHCSEAGCLQYGSSGCIRCIHAEINALTRCREKASRIYCTDQPCLDCTKALFSHNPQIEIYYLRPYESDIRDFCIDNFGIKKPIKIEQFSPEETVELIQKAVIEFSSREGMR